MGTSSVFSHSKSRKIGNMAYLLNESDTTHVESQVFALSPLGEILGDDNGEINSYSIQSNAH